MKVGNNEDWISDENVIHLNLKTGIQWQKIKNTIYISINGQRLYIYPN